jgi:peptidyl-dipeptidase Dcp
MKKLPILLIIISMMNLSACRNEKKSENPFLAAYETAFQVPPFDKIDTSDYMPAFHEGIKQQTLKLT